jgi:hypothetical protein
MTELMEKIQIHLDKPDSEDCPFCPGKETEHKWVTVKGIQNSSGKLRTSMNKPEANGCVQEGGTKPKDGVYPNQNKDEAKPSPNPIYTHAVYGDYGNQAHHCISGNEILKGHEIEKIIANESGDYKGQTGYTVNNAANGVYLPSYPENYSGNDDEKYDIVKLAMAAGKGQTHIGGHSGHSNPGAEDYPRKVKSQLAVLVRRIELKSEECPFCVENDGKAKKPFIPPYKTNQWLDNLSGKIKKNLTCSAASWPYFISKYAKRYHNEVSVPLGDPLDLL